MILAYAPQHDPTSAHPSSKFLDPFTALRDLRKAPRASPVALGQGICVAPIGKRVYSLGLDDDITRERKEKNRKSSGVSPLLRAVHTTTFCVENEKKL